MMRLVAVHLLLLAGLAVHLCLGGVQADNHISLYRGDSPADGEGGLSSGGINAGGPTNIIGRDNLCVDVKDGNYTNGNPIQLWPCEYEKLNQLWTFETDDKIHSNGTCMAMSIVNHTVFIHDCGADWPTDIYWESDYSGTIRNPESDLVLTASASTPGTNLTVDVDTKSSSQAWTWVNYTIPPICQIKGSRERCMKSNGADAFVGLEGCTSDESQKWVLYYDRTIRLSNNRSLCVTSDGSNPEDIIVLLTCQGTANERWTFSGNGTILNPNAGLVMEVKEGLLATIILADGPVNDDQKWSLFNCESPSK